MNLTATKRLAWSALFILSAVSTVIASGVTLVAPPAAADEIRIGAWNIEQLGSPDRRSPPSRNIAQKPEDLARYLGAARLDAVALSEIGDTDGAVATYRNVTLDKTFEILNAGGAEWRYSLFPKKAAEETWQLTGVAWNNARLKAMGEPYRVPVFDDPADEFDPWQRHPHAIKLSAGAGRTDFVLVPLHMKSNVGGAVTPRQRAYEAKALTDQLASIRRHFRDDDIVLLGDANCLKGTEPALAAYRAAGLRDLNAADVPTTFRGGKYDPAPFDRVFVPDQPEFRDSRFEVLSPAADAEHLEHKKWLSDHFLIVTTVAIQADDDSDQETGTSPKQ